MSPFGYGRGEGVDAGHGDPDWICSKEKPRYDQLFQSLNPIDGKVTGAGTYPLRRLMAASTHNCSLLTQLCFKASETADPNIDKLVDALAAAAQTCKLLAQLSAADADVSGVSIHSLHGASTDAIDYTQGSPDHTSTLPDDDDSETQVGFVEYNEKETNMFQSLFRFAQIVFLLLTNAIMIVIIVNLLFIATAYVLTGKTFLEFEVDKASLNWMDHAKTLAFGSERETIRIHTISELFLGKNLLRILREFVNRWDRLV